MKVSAVASSAVARRFLDKSYLIGVMPAGCAFWCARSLLSERQAADGTPPTRTVMISDQITPVFREGGIYMCKAVGDDSTNGDPGHI
jgi:hypothetical protein